MMSQFVYHFFGTMVNHCVSAQLFEMQCPVSTPKLSDDVIVRGIIAGFVALLNFALFSPFCRKILRRDTATIVQRSCDKVGSFTLPSI